MPIYGSIASMNFFLAIIFSVPLIFQQRTVSIASICFPNSLPSLPPPKYYLFARAIGLSSLLRIPLSPPASYRIPCNLPTPSPLEHSFSLSTLHCPALLPVYYQNFVSTNTFHYPKVTCCPFILNEALIHISPNPRNFIPFESCLPFLV